MTRLVPGVRRIAVLRAASGVGDYLLTVPALAALRAAYPDAELSLLGLAWHADFLTGRPGPVDQVLVLPPVPGVSAPPDADADPAEVDRLVDRLVGRLGAVDLALQLHGGGRYANPFVSRLGARLAAGLRAPDAPPLDRWVRYVHYQPEVVRYLEAVALVGAEPAEGLAGLVPRIAVTAADRAEAAAVLGGEPPPGGLVALHPGARDPRRRWPAERFAAVGDALAAAGRTVLVTGSPDEREVVERVVAGMRRPARPLVGALSLGGLAALYASCLLVAANDTGPRHLAEAVGCPTAAVFWCANLVNFGPLRRERHRPLVSWTVSCPVCGADAVRRPYPAQTGGPGCPHEVPYVTDVGTDEMIAACEDLLA